MIEDDLIVGTHIDVLVRRKKSAGAGFVVSGVYLAESHFGC